MTYLNTGLAATDEHFNLRVRAAMFKAAQDVLNESATVPNHASRATLAREVIWRGVDQRTIGFVWLCASNAAISDSVTVADGTVLVGASDNDLAYVVASNWTTVPNPSL